VSRRAARSEAADPAAPPAGASDLEADVVVAYGSRERLVVLPERSAEGLAADAHQLCALATARLDRPVRMALVGPAPGSTLREVLAELEVGLARCRISAAAVEVAEARAAPPAPAPEGAAAAMSA
jgi:hypothetical protein